MKHDAEFLNRERVGEDVMLFRLGKPEDFKFLAGQFCFLRVPDVGYKDERGLRRAFSIASSPLEKELLFVMKMSDSALKRTLVEIPVGTTVTLDEPVGSLILPQETATPLVFLAGGVGIAPFRSLMRYVADARTGHRIALFYSSQTPEETPFVEELQHLPDQYQQAAVHITMTRVGEDRKRWNGLTGRISPEMIKGSFREWEGAMYFIVGPPAMATGMKQMLIDMGIQSGRIKMELFTGY
jgi:ferredoxin-NADP reductase